MKSATDVQAVTSKTELAELKKKQTNKHIASYATNRELSIVANEFSYHASALCLSHNLPTTKGYTHLDKIVVSPHDEYISHLSNQHSYYYNLASGRASQ